MCGMGRTGTLHACEQDGIAPDLMTIAKGLGGGYQPIGEVLLSGKIFEAFSKGSGFFQHGHTYMGHPMAAAAGLAVQETIRQTGRAHLCTPVTTAPTVCRLPLESKTMTSDATSTNIQHTHGLTLVHNH